MESYSVNIDPEQVVRWLMVERARGSSGLRFSAARVNDRQPLDDGQLEFQLGDEEREDLSEEMTVGLLEIAPVHAHEGWRLIVCVEDELRPSDEEEDDDEEDGKEIDLDTFYLDFIRLGHGTATVIAEVDGPDGEIHLDQLLNAIETNVHAPEGYAARRRHLS